MHHFLQQIRTVIRGGVAGIDIDFSQTVKARAGGTLLVIAELDRLRRMLGCGDRFRCKPPQNSVVRQVFKQVDLFGLLNFSESTVIDEDSVRHWRYATGVRAAGEQGGTFLSNFEGQLARPLLSDLYAAVTEAMTNTSQHAYTHDRGDGLGHFNEPRWWMLSQERDNELSVAVCDLGIGIPRSLPASPAFGVGIIDSLLSAVGADKRDVESIKLAVGVGKSVTRLPYRGKGLGEILNAVHHASSGQVSIASNRGVYGLNADGRKYEVQFPYSIYGTLIEWGMPLDEDKRDDGAAD